MDKLLARPAKIENKTNRCPMKCCQHFLCVYQQITEPYVLHLDYLLLNYTYRKVQLPNSGCSHTIPLTN